MYHLSVNKATFYNTSISTSTLHAYAIHTQHFMTLPQLTAFFFMRQTDREKDTDC